MLFLRPRVFYLFWTLEDYLLRLILGYGLLSHGEDLFTYMNKAFVFLAICCLKSLKITLFNQFSMFFQHKSAVWLVVCPNAQVNQILLYFLEHSHNIAHVFVRFSCCFFK